MTCGPTTSSKIAHRDGRKFRTLNVVDEFTREALAIRVARRLKASDVIDVLADLFLTLRHAVAHPLGQWS